MSVFAVQKSCLDCAIQDRLILIIIVSIIITTSDAIGACEDTILARGVVRAVISTKISHTMSTV